MADRNTAVEASKLVQDYELYPRASVDGYHVNNIAEAINAGAALPPIIVDAQSLRVIDGFHRLRAWQKVKGLDVKVKVTMRDYESEAGMYEDAMRLNSAHGHSLSMYDKTRAIRRAQELGLGEKAIAKALNLTPIKVATLIRERFSAEGEPLKYTMRHYGGRGTTQEQRDFNRGPAGGMSQLFYIRQLRGLLEADAIDWSRDAIVAELRVVHGLLEKALVAK